MKSKVFFIKDASKSAELFDKANLSELISPNDSVALKIHFGEPGNTAYLKPEEVKPIFEKVASLGGKPFYTDCNTLYKGPRSNTKDHLKIAKEHGFEEVKIPEENDFTAVEVNLKHFKKVFIGGAAFRANDLIALTHFKGHELTGFGGALKNLGMGLGTRLGKLRMHQDCKNCPEVKTCTRNKTISSCWVGPSALVQEKIVEYAYGAVKDKKCGYVNFIIRVSPQCDCYGFNDKPIVADIGILASNDPVAIDAASANLVNQAAGYDIFKKLYPDVDWHIQLKYAEEIGMGSSNFEIIEL